MTYLKDRYVNFFTDYGFKRLFGEEHNKDLLRDFLNELLKDEQGAIVDLTFFKDKHLGATGLDRKDIFDLYCENERGEKFIVELQKAKHNFFKDRSMFYASFPIQHQAQRGDWNFELKAVYTIGILDFIFDEDKNDPDKYRYYIKHQNIVTNKVFCEELTLIYLALPKFRKSLDQLETRLDKWLYAIKHLDRLDRVPDALREQIFEKFFQVAEIANFSRDEVLKYEGSLKYYRDLKNVIDTAWEEGWKEGREERRKEALNMAKNLLDILDDETIALKTGLTVEEVAALRD